MIAHGTSYQRTLRASGSFDPQTQYATTLNHKRPALVALAALACLSSMIPSPIRANDGASGSAQSSYYRLDWCDGPDIDQRRQGWHFYCDDPPPEEPEVEPEVPVAKPEPPAPAIAPEEDPEPTAVEKLAAIRARVEEARAEAILHPDQPEKLATYMRLQAEVMEQASTFSDTWRRVVWGTPDLDYTLRRPTNTVAGPVFHEERNKAEIDALKAVSKTHGLFFIFEGPDTCATCAAQASILESIVTRYEIGVLGISRDGATLPQFPNPIPGGDRLAALGLADTPVPALVLVEPRSNAVTPLSFAAIAEDQILERLFVVTQSEPGDLY